MLAWALNCYKLPAHDDNSNIDDILDGLGFFQPPADTALHHGRLRTPTELDRYASIALTIHWRLREFGLNPKAINFTDFVRRAQWGPLSLDGVNLKDKDLSFKGDSVSEAEGQAVYFAQSIARERHQAINWLMGWDEIYSEVDTGT